MVICASITRYVGGPSYRFEPPLSLSIKEAIGAHAATSFDLSNACAGMMTGVFLLNDFIRRGAIRRGMVVSGEYISGLGANAAQRHPRHLQPAARVAHAGRRRGRGDRRARARRQRPASRSRASRRSPSTAASASGFPRRTAPARQMFTKARTIHKVAMEDAPPLLEDASSTRAGLRLADIDWLIPHQTSARAIRAGERELADALRGATRSTSS